MSYAWLGIHILGAIVCFILLIWVAGKEETDFKSAKRMANYLKLHNYPNITRSAIENIIKGTYKGEYQDLYEKIYRVKALDLYKEVSKYEN